MNPDSNPLFAPVLCCFCLIFLHCSVLFVEPSVPPHTYSFRISSCQVSDSFGFAPESVCHYQPQPRNPRRHPQVVFPLQIPLCHWDQPVFQPLHADQPPPAVTCLTQLFQLFLCLALHPHAVVLQYRISRPPEISAPVPFAPRFSRFRDPVYGTCRRTVRLSPMF